MVYRVALGVLVVSTVAGAEPLDGRAINPGVLGANALPTLPAEAPWVDDALTLQLGWSGQLSTPPGGGVDQSMLVPFRVSIGLFERVQFSADGSPFELWRYSPETNAAWAPKRSKGITRADVRLATKVLLFSESGLRPATAARVTLKTATGEDLFTRRFLDAPAYQLDAIAAWHWLLGTTRLEAWATVGFLAWQQGAIGQNDAFAYAATVEARWPFVSARLEVRGYAGWIHDDKPVTLAGQAEVRLTPALSLVVSAARTFQDPPTLDLGVAAKLRLDDVR